MPGKSWRAASDQDLAYNRSKTLEEQANAKQADFDDVTFKEHCLGFNLYFLICFTCTAVPCFVHVVLLSEMGAGSKTIEWLSGRKKISMYCAGYVGFLLIMLYLFDFFCPPHLPGRYLTFTKKDRGIRYFILGQLILGAGAAGFFYAQALPYLPTLVTVLTGPVLCGVARELTRPEAPRYTRKSKTTNQAIQMLANMVNDEKDCRNFYAAVMTAFIISGGLTAMAWLLWALNTGHAGGKLFLFKSDTVQEELEAIRRLTPLVGGAANMLLGFITMLRVSLSKDYQDTEDLRVNTIAAMGDDDEPEDDESRHSPERVIANFLKKQGTFEAFQQMDEGHRKTFVRYEMQIMAALFRIMKIIFCCFICLLGCLWVASELLVADSQLAKLLVAFVALIFLCFIAFLFLSFGRLMSSTKDWFLECPLGRMAVGMSSNDWFRAGVSAMVMPVVPPLLLLSMLNQLVRRFRGLYTRIPPRTARAFATQAADAPSGAHGRKRSRATLEIATIEVQVAPQDQLLTERFMEFIDIVTHWNWISVVSKVYLIGIGFVCFQLSPKLINVFLSWLSGMLSNGVPFPVTVVVTVVSGIACFLLPPVPGLPVYLFAGSIVAITCPAGFWAGCGIAIAMGMVLKLTACAIQQKCIGEALGSSKWIKSQVGVNKSFFRSVERILRKPGLSFGKVAILCGGPDWPTSVFCGVQHLSLVQCELGTMPILVFIAPCTLYGAFYTRQTESEVWKNATNVMLLVSVATNMFFGLGAAWAVQEELDENHWEVTKPLEEYIDLDWLDYRSEQLAQCCVVTWKDVPVVIRGIAVFFAIVEACVCHLFYQLSSFCFGTFNITDDINTLKVYGSDGLIKLPGAAALGASVFSLIGYFLLSRCVKKKRAGPEAERAKSLDVAEAGWKADREHQARLAKRASIRSVSETEPDGYGDDDFCSEDSERKTDAARSRADGQEDEEEEDDFEEDFEDASEASQAAEDASEAAKPGAAADSARKGSAGRSTASTLQPPDGTQSSFYPTGNLTQSSFHPGAASAQSSTGFAVRGGVGQVAQEEEEGDEKEERRQQRRQQPADDEEDELEESEEVRGAERPEESPRARRGEEASGLASRGDADPQSRSYSKETYEEDYDADATAAQEDDSYSEPQTRGASKESARSKDYEERSVARRTESQGPCSTGRSRGTSKESYQREDFEDQSSVADGSSRSPGTRNASKESARSRTEVEGSYRSNSARDASKDSARSRSQVEGSYRSDAARGASKELPAEEGEEEGKYDEAASVPEDSGESSRSDSEGEGSLPEGHATWHAWDLQRQDQRQFEERRRSDEGSIVAHPAAESMSLPPPAPQRRQIPDGVQPPTEDRSDSRQSYADEDGDFEEESESEDDNDLS